MIVLCCIVGGAAIMTYADIKRRSLQDPIPVETTENCKAKPVSCKRIS